MRPVTAHGFEPEIPPHPGPLWAAEYSPGRCDLCGKAILKHAEVSDEQLAVAGYSRLRWEQVQGRKP